VKEHTAFRVLNIHKGKETYSMGLVTKAWSYETLAQRMLAAKVKWYHMALHAHNHNTD
jgi:hypothetical protein